MKDSAPFLCGMDLWRQMGRRQPWPGCREVQIDGRCSPWQPRRSPRSAGSQGAGGQYRWT